MPPPRVTHPVPPQVGSIAGRSEKKSLWKRVFGQKEGEEGYEGPDGEPWVRASNLQLWTPPPTSAGIRFLGVGARGGRIFSLPGDSWRCLRQARPDGSVQVLVRVATPFRAVVLLCCCAVARRHGRLAPARTR